MILSNDIFGDVTNNWTELYNVLYSSLVFDCIASITGANTHNQGQPSVLQESSPLQAWWAAQTLDRRRREQDDLLNARRGGAS